MIVSAGFLWRWLSARHNGHLAEVSQALMLSLFDLQQQEHGKGMQRDPDMEERELAGGERGKQQLQCHRL